VLPLDELRPLPLVVLGLTAITLVLAGLTGFEKRDLQSA
jgi:hypothetical protein